MMKTALFVALALMAHRTSADQSRQAVELDEDLTPEEQVPGQVAPLPANVVDLFTSAFSAEVATALFGSTPAPVSTATVTASFATAGYTLGATKSGINVTGIPVITFTVKALPVTSTAPGTSDVTVVMVLTMDTAALQADTGGQKLALGLTLAKDLGVLYSQISALVLEFTSATGVTIKVGREATALAAGDVSVSFNICENLGCLGATTAVFSTYTTTQLALAPFARAATPVTFAAVTTAFPVGYTLADNTVGAAVSATVRTVPEQKPDATTSILFFMGVDVDWVLISSSAAASATYKKAWQYAVAQRLVINPFQVNDIAFVRMLDTTTVGRHAGAQAIERVNAHQTVCQTKCAPNQAGGGVLPGTAGPAFSEDDDSSIIAVAVIVPIAVIAIVLVIVWYLVCGGDEEKKDPVAPYGTDQEQTAGPDQTDEPVPAEDEAV